MIFISHTKLAPPLKQTPHIPHSPFLARDQKQLCKNPKSTGRCEHRRHQKKRKKQHSRFLLNYKQNPAIAVEAKEPVLAPSIAACTRGLHPSTPGHALCPVLCWHCSSRQLLQFFPFPRRGQCINPVVHEQAGSSCCDGKPYTWLLPGASPGSTLYSQLSSP